MKDDPKKPITIDEILTQQYLNDAKRTLDFLDMNSINSVVKTLQSTVDLMKKPLEGIQKIHKSYFSPMFNVTEIKYVRPPEYEIIEVLHEIKVQNAQRKKEIGIFIFNTKERTIERDTDTRSFKYKFLDKGMNFELVKILIDRNGFRQTRHLREGIKSKSNEAVRKKVGEINEKIKETLRLEKDFKFITGEPGAGYKINSDIKIKIIEE